jgi:hypothetical protein
MKSFLVVDDGFFNILRDALGWVRLKILVVSTKYFFNFLYDNHPHTLGEEEGAGGGWGV